VDNRLALFDLLVITLDVFVTPVLEVTIFVSHNVK